MQLRAASFEELAVDLEARRRGEAEGEGRPPNGADRLDRQVMAAEHRLEEEQPAERGDIVDRDEVDHPVIGSRARSNRQPAAVAKTVGEHGEQDGAKTEAVAGVELDRLVAEDLLQRGKSIPQRAANDALDSAHALQRIEHADVEAEAGDVERMPSIHAQRVDGPIGSLGGQPGEGDPRSRLAAECGNEVVARSAGEKHDATALAGPRFDDCARRLAPRPVAAEDGDRVGACVERAADAARLVAGALRQDRLADADAVEGAPNGMEQARGAPSAGCGICDQVE